MIRHIRLAATRKYELAVIHPVFTEDDINRVTNYLQWVEPASLDYTREEILTFLEPEENDGSPSVRVEFASEHIVGSLKADDALKYRAFLEKSNLETVIGVCDGAVYGKRPDLGRPMVFRLCLALDMDNLHPEDSLSWNKHDYR